MRPQSRSPTHRPLAFQRPKSTRCNCTVALRTGPSPFTHLCMALSGTPGPPHSTPLSKNQWPRPSPLVQFNFKVAPSPIWSFNLWAQPFSATSNATFIALVRLFPVTRANGQTFGALHGSSATLSRTVTGGQSTIQLFRLPLGMASSSSPNLPATRGLTLIATLAEATYCCYWRSSMLHAPSGQRANPSFNLTFSGWLR
jgi:hypothetical protein